MVTAAEYLKYWKVKEVWAEKEVAIKNRMVRHTYFVNAWTTLGGGTFMVPINGVITALFVKMGSQAKIGPPPRTTQERKVQGSLERLLRSSRHRKS
eukprot:9475950-Pyramimonas_sp.AAC.1